MSTSFAVLACFFFGLALACLWVIGWSRIQVHFEKQQPKKTRRLFRRRILPSSWFTAFCLTLSGSIASFTVALVFLESFDQIIFNLGTMLYYGSILVLGFISGIWYRIVLPVVILLFASYCLWSVMSLGKIFDTESRYVIRVDSDSIIVSGDEFEVSGRCSLIFERFSLPQRWLIPFFPNVRRFAGVVSAGNVVQVSDSATVHTADFLSITRLPQFVHSLLGSRREEQIAIPQRGVYPAVYILETDNFDANAPFTLKKVF
jgi:hypothetical protein